MAIQKDPGPTSLQRATKTLDMRLQRRCMESKMLETSLLCLMSNIPVCLESIKGQVSLSKDKWRIAGRGENESLMQPGLSRLIWAPWAQTW